MKKSTDTAPGITKSVDADVLDVLHVHGITDVTDALRVPVVGVTVPSLHHDHVYMCWILQSNRNLEMQWSVSDCKRCVLLKRKAKELVISLCPKTCNKCEERAGTYVESARNKDYISETQLFRWKLLQSR